jgi:uncharacterized protein HemY
MTDVFILISILGLAIQREGTCTHVLIWLGISSLLILLSTLLNLSIVLWLLLVALLTGLAILLAIIATVVKFSTCHVGRSCADAEKSCPEKYSA